VALTRKTNGQYTVKTRKQAIEALTAARTMKAEIQALMEEHGISDMMEDATEMTKAVVRYMDEQKLDNLQAKGFHGTLVRAAYDKRWIATDEELDEAGRPANSMSLRRILRKKFKNAAKRKEIWMRITKRVADPEGIDEVVTEGILTIEEVGPSYVEKTKAPYLRIYEDSP